MAESANKVSRNSPACSYILHFAVSVGQSINPPESPNDFTILIKSFISSFEINKVNPFPVLTARFPFIFFRTYLLHLKLNCLLIQVNFSS